MNEEVGIGVLTQMAVLKLLGTLYLPACRRQGTLYIVLRAFCFFVFF